MNVRDAVEGDVEALAALSNAPLGVVRNVVHDRTVRVLEAQDSGLGGGASSDAATAGGTPRGFVSYDVRDGVVHLTLFGGDSDACERLLEEPLRYADGEGMAVEVLVGDDDTEMREALDTVGFVSEGAGPRFRGEPTERFRYEATD
jgi:hypothetical protein